MDVAAQGAGGARPGGIRKRAVGLVLVYLSVFIDMLGVSIVVPILPFYALKFGASSAMVGVLFAVYSATAMVSTVCMGRISDALGRRITFLISLSGSACGFLLQGLAWDIPSLIGFRAVAGMFGGTAGVAQAYIADVTTKEERPKYLAYIGAVVGCAFLFGPALGSGLSQFSLEVPFFVSSGLAAFGFVLAYLYIENTTAPRYKLGASIRSFVLRDKRAGPVPATVPTSDGEGGDVQEAAGAAEAAERDPESLELAVRGADGGSGEDEEEVDEEDEETEALRDTHGKLRTPAAREHVRKFNRKGIALVCITSFLYMTAFTAFQSMFALFMETEYGLDSLAVGFSFSGLSVIFITSQAIVFGAVHKRIGLKSTAICGALTMAAGLFTMSLPDKVMLTLFCAAFIGLGAPLLSPALMSMLSNFATKRTQGRMLSYGEFSQASARVVGPIVMGVLFDIDPSLPFIAGGGVAVMCALVMMYAVRHSKRSRHCLDMIDQRAEATYTPAAGHRAPTDDEVAALGRWMAQLFATRRYFTWYDHLDKVEHVLGEAFPPLREKEEDRLEDIRMVLDRANRLGIDWRIRHATLNQAL